MNDTQLPLRLPPISSLVPLPPSSLEPNTQTDGDKALSAKLGNSKSRNQAISSTPDLPVHVHNYQPSKANHSSFPVSTSNVVSLPPISVLEAPSRLPPGTALFTDEEGYEQSHDIGKYASETDSTTLGTNFQKQKRVQGRGRVKWTALETADLLEGIQKHGLGKWKDILMDENFHFNPRRTTIDLKDRYRTCAIAQDREDERNRFIKNRDPGAQRQDILGDASSKSVRSLKHGPKVYSIEDDRIFSRKAAPVLAEKSLAPFTRWPAADDAELERGFQKHGFKWSLIANDPDIDLKHRTPGQIRDRFRVKFPQSYKYHNPQLPTSISAESTRMTKAGLSRDSELEENRKLSLPPLSKHFLKKTQPVADATTSRLAQFGNPEVSKDRRAGSVDAFGDLDFGSQLAPLRYPYDQDRSEDDFDKSLRLPPIISIPPDGDDFQ